MQDPNRETLDAYIDENFADADQWTREEAIYWFAYFYHDGQGSNLYSVLSVSPFNPSSLADGPEDDAANDVFNNLVRQFILD